jgi:carboxyl-terminal processing protease
VKPSVANIAVLLISMSMTAGALSHASSADDVSRAPSTGSGVPPRLAERVWQITEIVLEHHIDPPARQQMILSGIKALYSAVRAPMAADLSRRVSAVSTRAQLEALLLEVWPKSIANPIAPDELKEQFLRGLLACVSGNSYLVADQERRVLEQFEGNRYVGIHIALGMDEEEKRPKMFEVIEGGPADRAGVKRDDVIDEIDGVDTKGMPLRQVVDWLRGAEGTSVKIKVRQRNAPARIFTITRGQHTRPSVKGLRERSNGGWDFRLSEADPIGYLQITKMMGSTPHELRVLARQLESEGTKALVLDLRGLHDDSAHTAILLADSLLERGTIGRIRTSQREMTYEAAPDALFRGWPLAVLVDGGTFGAAEWLAAALQDNRRAVVVGAQTRSAPMSRRQMSPGEMGPGEISPGAAVVTSVIPLGDSDWAVSLVTGILERGNGTPLSRLEGARPAPTSDKREPSRFGVHPDHVVSGSTAPPMARSPDAKAAGKSWTKPDAVQQKALELLRQALKKN